MTNPKTTYKWALEKFSIVAARDSPTKSLRSPEFPLHGLNFYLRFDPTNRDLKSSKDYSSLYLIVSNFNGEEEVKVNMKFWLENNQGQKIFKITQLLGNFVRGSLTFNKQQMKWGYPAFIHHNKLYKNGFIRNDLLLICCKVEYVLPKPEVLFKWQIDNFSKDVRFGSNYYLNSKEFKIPSIDGKFNLEFYSTSQTGDYSSLRLCVKDLTKELKLICKFWIEDKEGEKIEKTAQILLFGVPSDDICFPEFVHHNQLYNGDLDDSGFICCKLKVLSKKKDEVKLCNSLKSKGFSVEEKGANTNYYIVPLGDDMLTTRGDKLHSLISNINPTTENNRKAVRFEDTSPATVKAFIDYANGREIYNLDGIATDLFLFANKYGIENLKIICTSNLIATLNDTNLFERLLLSFKYKVEELKQKSIHLLTRSSNSQRLFESPEWTKLINRDQELAGQIFDEYWEEKYRMVNLFLHSSENNASLFKKCNPKKSEPSRDSCQIS